MFVAGKENRVSGTGFNSTPRPRQKTMHPGMTISPVYVIAFVSNYSRC